MAAALKYIEENLPVGEEGLYGLVNNAGVSFLGGGEGGGGHLEADLLRGVLTPRLRDRDADLLLLLSALQLCHRLWSQVAVAPHHVETILNWSI